MRRLKPYLLPYLPVVLLPVILFGGPLLRLEALYWGTPGLQFIPWRMAAWEALSAGSLPLWNPLNGMGAPLAANYQTAFFYPPGWLLFLFAPLGAPWLAWAHTVVLVAHLIWASVGMVRLLGRMGFGELPQAVGAMAFAMGGYLVARAGFFSMVWTAAWLPWVLVAASAIAAPLGQKPDHRRWIPLGLVVSVAMMLLAGHAQLSWYILLLALVWVVSGVQRQDGWRGTLSAVMQFGVSGVLAGILALVQLLPTAEYLLQSQRSSAVDYETALSYSFWPWRFLTLLAPDFFGNPGMNNYWGYANYWEDAIYIGVLPVLLALGTLPLLWRKSPGNRLVRFTWVVTAVGFLMALGKNTPIFPFLYEHVPTFDMFNGPARWLIWPLFGLSTLAAVGVSRWKTPTGRGLYWLRLSTMGGFAVTLGAFLGWYFLREVSPTFIRATALAGLWGLGTGVLTLFMPSVERSGRRRSWTWLVVAWVGLDLLVAGWFLHPTVPIDFYAPAANAVNSSGQRVYLSLDDDDYLKFRRFFRFEGFTPLEDINRLRSAMLPNLNLLDHQPSANNFDPMVPGRYARWMEHLRNVPDAERNAWLALMNVGLEQRLDRDVPLGIRFEPVDGGERVRWYTCAVTVAGEEEAFVQVSEDLAAGRMDRLVLEGTPAGEGCHPDGSAMPVVSFVERTDRISIEIRAQNAGWVFLADTWYPGWRVTIDGASADILRANYLFRAVEVPPGDHRVEFRYRPASFTVGAVASSIGWLILLISVIIMRVSARKTG